VGRRFCTCGDYLHVFKVLETVAILQHRIGVNAVRTFSVDIFPVLTVEYITAEQHAKGMSALLGAARRRLGLVDCVSFDVMRQRGLREAFAFDKHFEDHGFTTQLDLSRGEPAD
jgi:predicted nucleic acid-binding protein